MTTSYKARWAEAVKIAQAFNRQIERGGILVFYNCLQPGRKLTITDEGITLKIEYEVWPIFVNDIKLAEDLKTPLPLIKVRHFSVLRVVFEVWEP